jgi:threonine dehydrogenase-like Zn-dependent dehydrogenase
MKALTVQRSVTRFAAARVGSGLRSGAGASGPGWGGRFGPLRYGDVDAPDLPGPDWTRVRPLLAGICGSDLATVEGRSSRWFEPIVSFPFVPGHEIVGLDDDDRRVVVQPVLGCEARGIVPLCPACTSGATNRCVNLTGGHLQPGLQTGFCAETGGGWSHGLVAHASQLHAVPSGWSDEAAVMVEPMACAVHGVLSAPGPFGAPGEGGPGGEVVVIGAGTLGLGVIAAITLFRPDVTTTIAVAKHPDQRRLAAALGAAVVAEPSELRRVVRRRTGSWLLDNGQLTGGVPVVFDCVGSAASIADALAVVAPGGTIVLLGMPGHVGVDLTGLWQREVHLVGAYAYGPEPARGGRHSFDLAMELVEAADLGRLVSASYPLDRHLEAIDHAASAGRRGATKVVFDLRGAKRRGSA